MRGEPPPSRYGIGWAIDAVFWFFIDDFFFRSARVAAEECWNGRGRLVAVVSCCRLVNERVVGPKSVRVTSWTNIQPEWRGIYLSVRCRLDASYETLHNANQVYLNHTTAAVRVENVVPDTRILKPSNIYSRVESSVRSTHERAIKSIYLRCRWVWWTWFSIVWEIRLRWSLTFKLLLTIDIYWEKKDMWIIARSQWL